MDYGLNARLTRTTAEEAFGQVGDAGSAAMRHETIGGRIDSESIEWVHDEARTDLDEIGEASSYYSRILLLVLRSGGPRLGRFDLRVLL